MLQAALISNSQYCKEESKREWTDAKPEGDRDSANEQLPAVTQTTTGRGSRYRQSKAGNVWMAAI